MYNFVYAIRRDFNIHICRGCNNHIHITPPCVIRIPYYTGECNMTKTKLWPNFPIITINYKAKVQKETFFLKNQQRVCIFWFSLMRWVKRMAICGVRYLRPKKIISHAAVRIYHIMYLRLKPAALWLIWGGMWYENGHIITSYCVKKQKLYKQTRTSQWPTYS